MRSVDQIKRGLKVGLPIMLAYFPIAVTFGVLASQAGLSVFELTGMSMLVYGGAAQMMAINMILLNTGALEIVIATFVLNFRHFIMSFSFAHRTMATPLKWRVASTLFITDETFSVTTVEKDAAKQANGHLFYFTFVFVSYLSWVVGSFIGGFVGDIIPDSISQSFSVALYAMFIALLVPSVKSNFRYGLIAILAMILNFAFGQFFQEGWSIVLSTLVASGLGFLVLRRRAS